MQRCFLAACSALAVVAAGSAASPKFQFNIVSVTNTQPGQMPAVTFSVTDPGNGNHPYDIKSDPAFTAALSRLTVQVGWDTKDYNNTGSHSEVAGTPAAAQPVSVEALKASFANGNGTFTVVSTIPLPAFASGTGIATLEGRVAAPDAAGVYTVAVPIVTAFSYFPITGTSIVPRRLIVDRKRCNTCHDTISMHGSNRTDQLQACAVCHNPNATDIPYRQYGDGPEQPIDFKYLVHAVHAGPFRQNPFQVMGFGHVVNDFSGTRFGQPWLETCEACHLPGAYEVPLQTAVQGTTTVTNSILTPAQKTVDNVPDDNLRITPTAAVCSACHDSAATRTHMLQNGASFNALQQSIDSGAVKELCVNCHGRGKSLDIVTAHLDGLTPTTPRLTSISQRSGVVNSSVPVTLTGVNLNNVALSVSGGGVTAGNVVTSATQITATLNIAAGAALGPRNVLVSGTNRGLTFTVNPPAPALASVTPSAGAPGSAVAITIRGTNLAGATLAATGTSTTLSGVTVGTSQINATLSISSSAAPGYTILSATTAGGVSNGIVFTINPASSLPTLASLTPSTGTAGTSVPVTIIGTNLSGAVLNISGSGVTATNIVTSAIEITATLNLASTAAAGPRTISAVTAAGTSNGLNFTVNLPPTGVPSVSAVFTPFGGNLGQSVPVALTGSNFVAGATALNFVVGTGITATNIVVVSSTRLTATLNIAPTASEGDHFAAVTTPGGTSSSRAYFQVFGRPSIAAISPGTIAAGTSVRLTINGGNFSPDSVIAISGAGLTTSNRSIMKDGTVLAITVTAASGALVGPRSLTIANSVGASNAVTLTVQ